MNWHVVFVLVLVLLLTALAAPLQPTYAANPLLYAANESQLVQAISDANTAAGSDTILLTADITLTASNETDPSTYGNTGLPPITDTLTLDGQGHTITRSANAATPLFRIFRVATGGNLTLYNLTVNGGKATSGTDCSTFSCGGGAYNEGTLVITHTTFSGNTARRGGGIYNDTSGIVTVIDSTFSGNIATGPSSSQGGGLYNNLGSVTVSDSIFSMNSASSSGGGILNNQGALTIAASTFSANTTAANGGGISGGATINGSTFSGNTATTGGGLYVGFETGIVINSTFSSNSAVTGGGVYFTDNAAHTMTVNNSTFFDNAAAVGSGGGIFSNTRPVTVLNSIIIHSTGGNCAIIGTGAVNGDAFSLTDDTTGCTGFTNSPSINLGALADNGGSTKTLALNAGSAAIDGGSPVCMSVGADQRGVIRGIDSVGGLDLPQPDDCDVGAFEYGGVIRTLQFAAPSSSMPIGLSNSFPVTLTLNSPLAGASAVKAYVWVSGGTAIAGTDYAPFGVQTVTLNPGEMAATATINLLNPPTTDKTIILSFATQRGPGFGGAVQLGTQRSHTTTLKLSPPAATINRNFYTTHTPTLTWTPISDATLYDVQVDTDTAFTAPYAFTATGIPADQLLVQTTSLPNGIYYWRVRANTGTQTWSAPERFEVFAVA